ncbi:MAG TPA: divalent-cation tolerance protein CutA [Thermoplasmata archaeon]|nr:divalent-cation tolerance protein CutA [Thermoplasmata archaeon]
MEVKVYLIYSTCGGREDAERIERELVKNRLAGCVNILPKIHSIYWWKDKVEEDEEVAFLTKTTKERVDDVVAKIKELHPYELPAIVAIPITKGSDD